jgi:hypothetical protein
MSNKILAWLQAQTKELHNFFPSTIFFQKSFGYVRSARWVINGLQSTFGRLILTSSH